MKVKDIPVVNRPREKFIRYGPARLTTTELLAIILRTGRKGENVLRLAKKLIKKFSKENLTEISFKQFLEIKGMGLVKTCEIMACFELGRRLFKGKVDRLLLSPRDVWQELFDIREKKKEHFVAFYLDARNGKIKREIVSVGTLNASLVHPREVFEAAVRNLAAQIIIAHNHPSGNLTPSEEDFTLTERLVEAGKILDIKIIDHVIVTSEKYLSFKKKGWLSS